MSEEKAPAPVELTPALAKAIQMPPALVEAIERDPELLVQLTRGQLAIVQDRIVRKALADPEISIAQLAVVHERLSKNARLEKEQPHAGGGQAKVVINIIRAAGKEPVTIEGSAVAVGAPE